MKARHDVFLLLGSNMGDRLGNIRHALMDIHLVVDEMVAISPVYETSPWGVEGQQDYLNVAVHARTGLFPFGMMHLMQEIECSMGRLQKGDMAPRAMDIDILMFDDWQLVAERLMIPHPRMHLRKFVLRPLSDIAPNVVVPGIGITVMELLENCNDKGEVVAYIEDKDAL